MGFLPVILSSLVGFVRLLSAEVKLPAEGKVMKKENMNITCVYNIKKNKFEFMRTLVFLWPVVFTDPWKTETKPSMTLGVLTGQASERRKISSYKT